MLRSVSALCDSWSRRSWWTMTRLLSDIRFQLQPNQLTAVDRPRAPEVANRQATQVTFCVRGVVSPLLANLFLHYTFDLWMRRNHPDIPFERYADDGAPRRREEEVKKKKKKRRDQRGGAVGARRG